MGFLKKLVVVSCFILLFSSIASSQIKVACIGNSITYGYGLSSPSSQSYPARLQVLLGNDYKVSNFGVSARTLLKKGDRPYWNESQYTQSLALKPDIVIIMLGTNDAKLNTNWTPHKNEFIADYKALIQSYSELSSNPEIWICQIAPAYKTIWEISDATILNEVNPMIKQVALEEGLSLIDMYTAMLNKSSLFQSDGIHPTANGAQAMADYIHNVMLNDTILILEKNDTLIAPEGYGYQWYFNEQLIEESKGGKNQKLDAAESGSYKVGVKVNVGSSTTIFSAPCNFIKIAANNEKLNDEKLQVRVFPNPCSSNIILQTNGNTLTEFLLYSTNGSLVLQKQLDQHNENQRINLASLSDGHFVYVIKNENNSYETGQLLIQQ